MIQQRPSTTERKQTRSARIEKEEFTQTMKIHSLSTNSPPPVLMESQVKVHSLTAKCHSNPNWSEKMLFTHTHTHTYFEAKVFTVVAKLKPLAWTQSEEDAWAGTTAMKSAHNISRASLSLLSHPGRETHSTHLFIFLRHWKHLGNDWIFLLFGGGKLTL